MDGMAFLEGEEAQALLRQLHVNMPWKYLDTYMELIVRLRLNIELGFEAQELDRVTLTELRSLAGQLQRHGSCLTMHGPFWDLNPGSVDPFIREVSRHRLQQFLDLSGILHPIQVVCHTGFDPRHHGGHLEFWMEQSLSFWGIQAERARAVGTVIALENVWELDPGIHRKLLEGVGSPSLGFCLDVGHQNSFSTTPLGVWLDELSDYVREIHLHDNDGSKDSHLPVGRGNVDFEALFGFLRSRGTRPVLTLEPHRKEHLAESVAGLLRYLSI
jgi:sugar phosphate isomerase/epimerase